MGLNKEISNCHIFVKQQYFRTSFGEVVKVPYSIILKHSISFPVTIVVQLILVYISLNGHISPRRAFCVVIICSNTLLPIRVDLSHSMPGFVSIDFPRIVTALAHIGI